MSPVSSSRRPRAGLRPFPTSLLEAKNKVESGHTRAEGTLGILFRCSPRELEHKKHLVCRLSTQPWDLHIPPEVWSPGYLVSTSGDTDLRKSGQHSSLHPVVFELSPTEPRGLSTLLWSYRRMQSNEGEGLSG